VTTFWFLVMYVTLGTGLVEQRIAGPFSTREQCTAAHAQMLQAGRHDLDCSLFVNATRKRIHRAAAHSDTT
jgi:hypothetical protein